jgi:hypothetical protein
MSDVNNDQFLTEVSAVPSDDGYKLPLHPATQKQKIILVSCNLVLAIGMIVWAYFTIQKFNEVTFVEFSTSWKLPAGTHLKDGPSTFNYDPDSHMLSYRGQLDAQLQMQLRDLLEFDVAAASTAGGSSPIAAAAMTNATIRSYREAIDKLAFQAGTAQVGQIQLLLLLGFMGGTLGAILRSLVDFVGHACYTGKLDLMHWWPLYVTRPLVGAILGFVLVVLLKARLLTSADIQQGSESFWWLGVAVIGGFSTVDVTQRLRLAAKALFGSNNDNSKG